MIDGETQKALQAGKTAGATKDRPPLCLSERVAAMGKGRAAVRTDRAGRLFDAVLCKVKQAGDFDKAGAILDDCCPCVLTGSESREAKLDLSKFNFVPCLTFAGGDGIHLSCYLTRSNNYGHYSICIGTMMTRCADMDACKIMGELCGALTFHARQYLEEQCRCKPVPAGQAPRTIAKDHMSLGGRKK